MPTYVYQISPEAQAQGLGCECCTNSFETFQHMTDDAHVACPECGAAIQRVIQPVFFGDHQRMHGPSDDAIARGGFTKYVKKGKGYYERQVGSAGPEYLTSDHSAKPSDFSHLD
jgi:putative FmdB family regulatory protein